MDAEEFARKAQEQGVLVHAIAPRRVRLVTHLDVGRDDVLQVLRAFEQVLRGGNFAAGVDILYPR